MDEVKHSPRRSYRQYCGLARALDVVGDRWNLLIVRELLAGPLRYSELKASLGTIATNLLADRLRALEDDGVVERRVGDSGLEYALTPWGAELREALEHLGRWGAPLLAAGRGDDAFRPRWLVVALPAMLRGAVASPPVEVGLSIDDHVIRLRVDEHGPHAAAAGTHRPDTVLMADAETVVGLAAGALTVEQAVAAGGVTGDPEALHRIFAPRPPGASR